MERTELEGTQWVRATLDVLGGKWKILILWHLRNGAKRYSVLRRSIPEISEKMLISQLKELEKDGIVRRTVLRSVPPQVEYAFTPHGDTLLPVLEALCTWGEHHEKRSE
ncbi:winged helix-turn-helix transcriptional regulator [Gloeobacter violaceus]|uniref:Glr4204 protein n=1 Tax=Gloeobacter violaceus (strain ATCC 29082 / PCC 7421) TaxID=251221 RepID=Q7NDN1_GLOVI|nr:helix-turn-helix domain-containing protein [Gloeobacter violaceus]BAC92145.1 glr4204 [Gloeobacter violaceus PCC 7421]